MYAFGILILTIIALGAAKNVPALAVLGIVTLLAVVLRRQTAAATDRLLALGQVQVEDPWATPPQDVRRLLKRSLKLSLDRTELASCFPGRGL